MGSFDLLSFDKPCYLIYLQATSGERLIFHISRPSVRLVVSILITFMHACISNRPLSHDFARVPTEIYADAISINVHMSIHLIS